jgi:hypothetical protein
MILLGKTEIIGEKTVQGHFIPPKSHMNRPGISFISWRNLKSCSEAMLPYMVIVGRFQP